MSVYAVGVAILHATNIHQCSRHCKHYFTSTSHSKSITSEPTHHIVIARITAAHIIPNESSYLILAPFHSERYAGKLDCIE